MLQFFLDFILCYDLITYIIMAYYNDLSILEHKNMLLGYIRKRSGPPSIHNQEEALKKMGLSDLSDDGPVYRDEPSKEPHVLKARAVKEGDLVGRERLLRDLTKGDEIVVSDYATLFLSPADAMKVVERIAQAGAGLIVAEDGARYRWQEADALIAGQLAGLVQKTQASIRSEIAAVAREARTETGSFGGRPPSFTGERRDRAREQWVDPDGPSQKTIAETFGVSKATLHRAFGSRAKARAQKKKSD